MAAPVDATAYHVAPAPAISNEPVQRKGSRSTESFHEKQANPAVDHEAVLAKDSEEVEEDRTRRQNLMHKVGIPVVCPISSNNVQTPSSAHSSWEALLCSSLAGGSAPLS
jgi:hypothetical protein